MQDLGNDINEYKEISVLNEAHHVYVVQHIRSHTVCLKKIITVYDIKVYTRLFEHPMPGIPRIYSLHEENGTLTVIEEFISGRTLQAVLEEDGLMTENTVAEYICRACDILTALHGQDPSIIHRDIKPSNIMLTDDGRIILIDLNAARTHKPGQSKDTRFLGTDGYAPPEQVGYGQTVPQTDIYALGVTMNILLTGKLPSEQTSSGALRPVIEKCTKNDPENRYASAELLKKHLLKTQRKNHTTPAILVSLAAAAIICVSLLSVYALKHIPLFGQFKNTASPVGVYTGNDLEILVIDDTGLAYYYCIEPQFTELECPWRLENNRLAIDFARMHCTVYANLKDTDGSELILQSDSMNWNTEVFSKIDLKPSEYIERKVELHDPKATLNADGSIDYVMQDINFNIPKTFIDYEDDFDKTEDMSAFIETDVDDQFTSGLLFVKYPVPVTRIDFDRRYSSIFKLFNDGLLNESSITGINEATVAGYHSYTADVNGRFNKGFSILSGLRVSGKATLIHIPDTNTLVYTALFQTDSRKYDSIPSFEEMLENAGHIQ